MCEMAKYLKLLPVLLALALLAGVPSGVSGQQPPPEVTVSIVPSSYIYSEGEGEISIDVEISAAPSFDVQVGLSTTGGTAVAGSDYLDLSATVTFEANTPELTRFVAFARIIDNDVLEVPLETFFVSLDTPADARVAVDATPVTIEIYNNDVVYLGFQRTQYNASSGDEVQLCVEIHQPYIPVPSDIPFDVHISYIDPGEALSSETTIPASLSFEPSGRVECFSVRLKDDAVGAEVEFRLQAVTASGVATDDAGEYVLREEVTRSSARVPPSPFKLRRFTPQRATVIVRNGEPFSWNPEEDFSPPTATMSVDGYIPHIWADTTTLWLSGAGSDFFVYDPILGPIHTQGAYAYDLQTKLRDAERDVDGISRRVTVQLKGIWSDGSTMWAAVNDLAGVFVNATDLDTGERDADRSSSYLDSFGNGHPQGMWSDGDTMWVADWDNAKIYAYNLADWTRDASSDFDTLKAAGNTTPAGIWSDRTTMWVADVLDNKIYAYDFQTKLRDGGKDFDDVISPWGISSDGTYMWVSSRFNRPDILAYDLKTKARAATQDFDNARYSENNAPSGMWSEGRTMYVSDWIDDKIYAYNWATRERNAGRDFDTLTGAGNDEPRGIWSDRTTMWVADSEDGKIFAYDFMTGNRKPGKDFDTLTDAGNGDPRGIWSDETTLWVLDQTDNRIYAYNLATKERDSEKDFDTLISTGNPQPGGIWSNGQTIWVMDPEGRNVRAYNLATKERDAEKEFGPLAAPENTDPEGIWSNGSHMWVTDVRTNRIYAYTLPPGLVNIPAPRRSSPSQEVSDDPDPARASTIQAHCTSAVVDPDGGTIELGDTIEDSWASGCPSVTRGGRLAKYYTFDLPITTNVDIALDSHLDDYLVLRRGGLSGDIVEQDDDDGPGNNSLISSTLKAGRYTIEATTFYADGVEADFTLSVKAVPRVLYDGPVADVAHADYTPDGPNMTVKLLPTLPMGMLEITIEDADGFGEGAGPLGGTQADDASAGTAILTLPKAAWVQYDGITVETREANGWTAHTQADEQAMLAGHTPRSDLSPALLGLIEILGQAEGALPLLQYLSTLVGPATADGSIEPDESVLDSVFRKAHGNCVSQVTVPWLVDAGDTTGVRISVPVTLADTDYLSLATSFVASGEQPALAQLHDLLATSNDAPACQRPSLPAQ